MAPRIIFIDNGRWFEPVIAAGINGYRDQHQLAWDVQYVQRKNLWRQVASVQAAPTLIAGRLKAADIDGIRAELPDIPLRFVTAAHVDEAPGIWSFSVERRAAGIQAVDHLHAVGYRHIAMWGEPHFSPRADIFAGVEQRCAALGMSCHAIVTKTAETETRIEAEEMMLATLRRLPKPLAIFGFDDRDAAFTYELCTTNGLRVPDEVGILGVGDDAAVCERFSQPLSSVRMPWHRLGGLLAETLHRLAGGVELAPCTKQILPIGVTARASTALDHSSRDPFVRRFLNLARKQAAHGLTVADCADRLGVDPATLFRRVVTATRINPRTHLQNARLAVASKLLHESDLPLADIAKRCGYANATHFGTAFKKRYSTTPGLWRIG